MSIADTPPTPRPRRNLWRVLLLLLLLIPAIPSLYLLILNAQGSAAGCNPAGSLCVIGGRSLGEVAKRTLDAAAGLASFFVFLGAFLFAASLVPIHKGFAGAGSRILVALFTGFWSVLGAIIMGFVALANIAPHCSFNEGGVGTCRIFGVATQSGHHIGTAIWGVMIGVPLAALVFLIYAIVVTIAANNTKQKTLTFPPRNPA